MSGVIDRFLHSDIDFFLRMADAEGWVCDRWELEFLLQSFPSGCLVARVGGVAVGFVTAVHYGTSGWIGNLIVQERARGTGIGGLLLNGAISALQTATAKVVWLTASPMGKEMYQRRGFVVADSIQRWRGVGKSGCTRGIGGFSLATMAALDSAAWGDRRDLLLNAIAARGEAIGDKESALLLQPCGTGRQIAAWVSGSAAGAERVFEAALAAAGMETPVCLDVPCSNRHAAEILSSAGFVVSGGTELMCYRAAPDADRKMVYSLASMGSIG